MYSHRSAVAFILMSVITTLPILLNPYLPLIDLPNHIARLFIAAHPGSGLTAYYNYDLDITPNSALDLIWYLTGYPTDAATFTKILMAIYPVNFVASVMVLSRVALGRWTIWPSVAALLVYNAPFYWGFAGYLTSIPFSVYLLALWLALEKTPNGQRIGVFIPLSLMLFFMHLFAFMLLAVAVLGREVQRLVDAGPQWKRLFVRNIALCIPFVIPVCIFVYFVVSGEPNPGGSKTDYGSIYGRVLLVFSPFFGGALDWKPTFNLSGVAAAIVLCAAFFALRRSCLPRLKLVGTMKGSLLAVLILAILMPHWINGVAFLNTRYPFVLLGMLLAASQWQGLQPRMATALAIAVLATLSFRSWELNAKANKFSGEIQQLEVLFETLPPDSKVHRIWKTDYLDDAFFWHVDAYAVPMAQAFVPTLFRGTHSLSLDKQWAGYIDSTNRWFHDPQAFSEEAKLREPKIHERFAFWKEWQRKFTHVLMLSDNENVFVDSPLLERVAQSGRFSLFRVIKADTP